MRYLLDTNTFYWWMFFPELLPKGIEELLCDPDLKAFVSAVSAYEMSYKHHRGKWPEIVALVRDFEQVVAEEGFLQLPLSAAHATRAGMYPAEHRDPFDRLLAGQAEIEAMTLVTKDRWLRELGAEVVWCT